MSLRQQVQELSQGFEQTEDAQANAWLDKETATAAEMFEGLGLEVDPEELYQYAAEREITDVQTAAKALAFDRLTEMVSQQSGQPGQLPEEFAQFGADGGQQVGQFPAAQQGFAPPQRQAMAAQTPRGGLASASQPAPQRMPESVSEAFGQTLQDLGIGDLRQVDMTA